MTENTATTDKVTDAWVEEFMARWLAAVNSRQLDRLLELMTDDIVYHDSGWPQTRAMMSSSPRPRCGPSARWAPNSSRDHR